MSLTNDIRIKLLVQAHLTTANKTQAADNPIANSMVDMDGNGPYGSIKLVLPGVVDESESGGGTLPRIESSIVGAEAENPTLKGVGLRIETGLVMIRVVFPLEAGVYQMEGFYQAVGAIAARYPVGVLGPTSRPRLSSSVNLTITGAPQIKEPVREGTLIYFPIVVPYRASWDDAGASALSEGGANSPPS